MSKKIYEKYYDSFLWSEDVPSEYALTIEEVTYYVSENFEKFEDIHDVMFDLEEQADHVANGFYRELSSKIKETQSEEE